MEKYARTLAVEAHGDQKYGNKPYVVHLDDVVAVLAEAGHTDEAQEAVGFLHDVLEDTELEERDLEWSGFGWAIVKAIRFCSDEEGYDNRKKRKAATYARMAAEVAAGGEHVLLGVRAKLADRIANLRAGGGKRDMYRKEDAAFRTALGGVEGCETLWALYEVEIAK